MTRFNKTILKQGTLALTGLCFVVICLSGQQSEAGEVGYVRKAYNTVYKAVTGKPTESERTRANLAKFERGIKFEKLNVCYEHRVEDVISHLKKTLKADEEALANDLEQLERAENLSKAATDMSVGFEQRKKLRASVAAMKYQETVKLLRFEMNWYASEQLLWSDRPMDYESTKYESTLNDIRKCQRVVILEILNVLKDANLTLTDFGFTKTASMSAVKGEQEKIVEKFNIDPEIMRLNGSANSTKGNLPLGWKLGGEGKQLQ